MTKTRADGIHAPHRYGVWVDPGKREQVVETLNQAGIGTGVNNRAIHLLSYFAETLEYKVGDFPNAERIGNETLSLPFYPTMPEEHVVHVATTLRELMVEAD